MLFPKDEVYSLSNQIRRSSRSVCSNLAESYGKRVYPKHFRAKITDAKSENFETETWLDFALKFGYLSHEKHLELMLLNQEVSKLLSYMLANIHRYQ